MSTLPTLLLMIVVVVGLRLLVRRRAAAREAALGTVAAMLGLDTSMRDGLGRPVPRDGGRADGASRRGGGLATAATVAWGQRRELHGLWNGRSVSIGAVPTRRYRVAVAAAHQWPPAMGFWAQAGSSNLGAPPPRHQRVRSGDDAFDDSVAVFAADRQDAEALVRGQAVRTALLDLVRADASALVADGWVQVRPYDDALSDVDVVRQMLDTVTRVAAALDRAGPPGVRAHAAAGAGDAGATAATSPREFP